MLMANTYSQIYLQLVFGVTYREAKLDKAWRNQVFSVIGKIINESKCKTIIVNGVEDHVHCFVGLKPSVSISELMKATKARSSKYINEHRLTRQRFEWQEGFGAFSYSPELIDKVYHYIKNQEIHHQSKTFRDEYRELLAEFNVNFDEQYIFQDLI